MLRVLLCAWTLLLFCTFSSCRLPTRELARENWPDVWIVAAGELRGEVTPCGCDGEVTKGGLPRRGALLDQRQQQHARLLYLDLGNNFPPQPSEQGDLKVKFIQHALRQFRPQVILVGASEIVYGLSHLERDLPYLLSNQSGNEQLLKESTLEIAGKRIGILGYLSPRMVYQERHALLRLDPVDNVLLAAWAEIKNRKRWDHLILLFRGYQEELETFEQCHLFDLCMTGNNDESGQLITTATTTHAYPAVPMRGAGVTEGKLTWDARPIFAPAWLSPEYPDHPELFKMYEAYDREVQSLYGNMVVRRRQEEADSPYAGAAICQTCHEEEYKIWANSGHSQAFATLERIKKHFNPECIKCHVVGFQQKGFLSPKLTPLLMNVQCENCHGARKKHSQDPTHTTSILPASPARTVCISCHRDQHSPKFDFSVYWPKIRHGSKR